MIFERKVKLWLFAPFFYQHIVLWILRYLNVVHRHIWKARHEIGKLSFKRSDFMIKRVDLVIMTAYLFHELIGIFAFALAAQAMPAAQVAPETEVEN